MSSTAPRQDLELARAGSAVLARVEELRIECAARLDPDQRAALGQFLTPRPIAELMAGMPRAARQVVRLLDPGAGVGSLTAAYVARVVAGSGRPQRITVTAFEIDHSLATGLKTTMDMLDELCRQAGVAFEAQVLERDFVAWGASRVAHNWRHPPEDAFTCAILNPPYRKIRSDSPERKYLAEIGVQVPNLYAAFVACSMYLLGTDGEIVAITPRSFCNGTYFKHFRRELLREMTLRRLHVFESRTEAFRGDDILQENIILHAQRGSNQRDAVVLTSSLGPTSPLSVRRVSYERVVWPTDGQNLIHVPTDPIDDEVVTRISAFSSRLSDLGMSVSTGRVVDFRAREYLQRQPGPHTVPLIYPANFDCGSIRWPLEGRKPSALLRCARTADLLVPNGAYVLVRRFSAKEERRRVVSAVYEGTLPFDAIGFENHLNYFHRNGEGLDRTLAWGMGIYLNSWLVDSYLRQFSGHTQVNAHDLRAVPYPDLEQLRWLGQGVVSMPPQHEIDSMLGQLTPATP